jgi:hypothetical protein
MEPQGFDIGDKVKIISKRNGSYGRMGAFYEIINLNGLRPRSTPIYDNNTYLGVEVGNSRRTITLYHGDLEYAWANRKEHAEYLKEKIKELEKDIKAKKLEMEHLLKYKDEEEELAHKIKEILENKNDVVAIAEILRKHKTDLL